MKVFEILKNAGHALIQNRRRTILTMLGIIIGISSVITILSLGNGFEKYTIKNLTQTNKKVVSVQIAFTPNDMNLATNTNQAYFNQNDLTLLNNILGIQKVTYVKDEQDTLYQTFNLRGANYSETVSLVKSGSNVILGRNISATDNKQHNRVAVIDKTMAKSISNNLNQVLGFGLNIDGQLYQVVGIMDGGDGSLFSSDSNAEIPKGTYKFLNSQSSNPQEVSITIDSNHRPTQVTNEAIKVLTNQGSMRTFGTYSSIDLSSLTNGIGKVLNMLTLFISAIAGISLLIAGVGVMNMMYTSVAERTKEIGIRRSVGARKKDIRNQFLAEGLLLTVSAGIIGYILGFMIALLVSQFLPFRVSPDLYTISIALGTTIIIGLVFSIMPANQAARKDLVEILR